MIVNSFKHPFRAMTKSAIPPLALIFCLLVLPFSSSSAEQTATPYPIKLYTQSGIEAASQDGLSIDGGEYFTHINEYKTKLNQMRLEVRDLSQKQQMPLALQIRETEIQLRNTLGDLLEYVDDKQKDGQINPLTLKYSKALLIEEGEIIQKELEYVKDSLKRLKQNQATLNATKLFERKQSINKVYQLYNGLLEDLLENTLRMKAIGVPHSVSMASVDAQLKHRAISVAIETKLSLDALRDLKEQIKKVPDNEKEAIQSKIFATEEYKDGLTNSLTQIVDLLHKRDMETTEYSELLLKATGQISSEILDKDVVFSLVNHWLEYSKEWIKNNGVAITVKIIFVIAILLISKLMAGITKRLVRNTIGREPSRMSGLMGNFFVSMSGKLVMTLGLLVALSQLGLQVTPLLAGLGIAGFIVGFALQDVLSNFASGVMILIYQPFDVGDTIEVPEVSGYVQNMNLVSTIILTYDNQKLVVPNNKIWGNIIRNVHSERLRRVDLTVSISYDSSLDRAEEILAEILNNHELVLSNPEAKIKLHALNESSVDFVVRPWTQTKNYWEVYWDLTRSVKERFDAEGISIPYPQRDIHIKTTDSSCSNQLPANCPYVSNSGSDQNDS